MQIRLQSMVHFTVDFLQDKILSSFSPLQKKMILVSSIAFASLAAILLLNRYCFNKKADALKLKKEAPIEKEVVKEAKKEDAAVPDKVKSPQPVADKTIVDDQKKVPTEKEVVKEAKTEQKAIVVKREQPLNSKPLSDQKILDDQQKSATVLKEAKKVEQAVAKKIEPPHSDSKIPSDQEILDEKKVPNEVVKEAAKEDESVLDKRDLPIYDQESYKVEPDTDDTDLEIPDENGPLIARKRPNLFNKFVPPSDFTVKEAYYARQVIGTFMHTCFPEGYAFNCPGMQDGLVELESRKKVMNYLLKEGYFEAWAFGWSGIPLVKTFLTDKCPPPKTGWGFQCVYTWRTRKTLENEAKFMKKNWIDPAQFSDDELKKEFPEENQRKLFFYIVKRLNTRFDKRPFRIHNHGQEHPILEFLQQKKFISKFEDREYRWPHPDDTVYLIEIYPRP